MSRRRTGIRAHHRLKVSAYREVPGRYYDTPKELWDLSLSGMKGTPRQVAKAALRANSALLGLDPKLRDLGVRHVKQTVAGHHVIFGQKHLDTPIHRAYVTVHMNRKNEVYLVKNRAVPAHLLPASKEIQISASKARTNRRRFGEGEGRACACLGEDVVSRQGSSALRLQVPRPSRDPRS